MQQYPPMHLVANILPWAQITLAAALTACILLQRSAEGLGGALGGGDMGGMRHTRRGFEKFLFYMTIVIAVLFAASALVSILLK